ncbi:hypothetical protein BH09BAC3_BH09BAC3_09950 [soil metagenome]
MTTPSHDHVIPGQGNSVEIWGMRIIINFNAFHNRNYLKSICQLAVGVAFLLISGKTFAQTTPQLEWAFSVGGADVDQGKAITIDGNQNILLVGSFRGTVDFDPGPGISNLTAASVTGDEYIVKLDANRSFVWAKQLGNNTGRINSRAVTTDAAGNVYLTGEFEVTVDFDPGTGVSNLTENSSGSSDIFVLKLDIDGNFVWAKGMGGSGGEIGNSISVDASGNVYSTGTVGIGNGDFDPGPSVFNLTNTAGSDVFISKLNADGNFVWAILVGGTGICAGYYLYAEDASNLFITGSFSSTVDFDSGTGTTNLTAVGSEDVFILALDAGGTFNWAKSIGTGSVDRGATIFKNASGNLNINGRSFGSSIDLDPGPATFTLSLGSGIYDLELNTSGNFITASVRAGSITNPDNFVGHLVAYDATGSIFTTGSFTGSFDIDPTCKVFTLTSSGPSDIFVRKVNFVLIVTPTISSFNPSSGSVGATITITGTNFSTTPADNEVKFFNNIAATVTASTATSLTVTVPTGTATGKISVTTNCVTVLSATNFTLTSPQNFITQWNLATAGSGATQLSFGTATSGAVNYTWQEISPGSASGSGSWSGATLTITGLPTGATIRLQIAPTNFQRIIINNGTNRNRLTQIEQWGSAAWTSMNAAFYGCVNLQVTATDVPNLLSAPDISQMFRACTNLNSPSNIGSWSTSAVTNTYRMFYSASSFNQNIGAWNTGAITDMAEMFYGAAAFNQNINSWNTGAVNTMSEMFANAGSFNQNIGAWNTGAVTTMYGMFYDASAFNQNIGPWNTAAVTDMEYMFYNANVFNQNIGAWNTGAVTTMSEMFASADSFNQNIGSWNTGAVTYMFGMFDQASSFNQDIGSWNTAAVTDFRNMFSRAIAFNQDIGSWNTAAATDFRSMFSGAIAFNQNIGAWSTGAVSRMGFMFDDASSFNQNIGSWNTAAVTDMQYMFYNASAFNQNIGSWNTGAVTSMEQMFQRASAFNQNISTWNTGAVTTMFAMFDQASAFNQNIGAWTLKPGVTITLMLNNTGMDCNNYSATLLGWSANPSTPTGRTLGATGRQYGTNAVAARTNLTTTRGWTIAGDTPSGAVCSSVSIPTITSLNPTSGMIGASVIITGTNFGAAPANNTVKFNGTTAVVAASTATSITTNVPTGATTGKITVTVAGNTATSSSDFTVTSLPTNRPPVIVSSASSVPIEGIVTINLLPLLSDPDGNLDLSTLSLLNATSEQGAETSINKSTSELIIDYGNVFFAGTDRVSLSVCDLLGECAEQKLTIEVGGDINIYNALSPNGANPTFYVQNINSLPETKNNSVTIFDRWQNEVWSASNYDNSSIVFKGVSNSGSDLPTGIYFYKIEFSSGKKMQTGFISLKR